MTSRLAEVEEQLAQSSKDESSAHKAAQIPCSTSLDDLTWPALGISVEPASVVSDTVLYSPLAGNFSFSSRLNNFDDIDLDFWEQANETQAEFDELPDVGQTSHTVEEDGAAATAELPVETRTSMSTQKWQTIEHEQSHPEDSPIASDGSHKAFSKSPGRTRQIQCLPNLDHKSAHDFDQMSPSSEDDMTQQMSRRMGRMCLTEDGHMRYFGATSHQSMVPNELRSLYGSSMRNSREEGEIAVRNQNLSWTPDHDFELHLTRLYFAWHNTFVGEVCEEIYFREKERYNSGCDTPLFSPALENAVFAIQRFVRGVGEC